MPWKLIIALLLFSLIVVFIGFNLENTATVSFGFYEFKDIPVFISLFIAFIGGAIVMLPFTMGKRTKQIPKSPGPVKALEEGGEKPAKKPGLFGGKKKESKPPSAEIQSDNEQAT